MATYKLHKYEYYKVCYIDTLEIKADSLDEAIDKVVKGNYSWQEVLDTTALHETAESTGDVEILDEEGNTVYNERR